MDEAPPFIPEDTLAFFIRKGLKAGYHWLDIQREEHDRWFTVAKMMQRDLLADTYDVIRAGLEAGDAPAKTAKRLRELLAERGWWGQQMQTDPLTGARELVQLGSRKRVDTIVRTNMRTSYAAGRWARQQRTKEAFPFLRYVSVKDGKERPEHGAWHNTVLPANDPWWDTHYGPCDWGCRCKAVSLNARMMARLKLSVSTPPHFGTRTWTNKRTGEVREIEKGIGAGWDYHPGKSAAGGLTPEPMAKPFSEESAAQADAQDAARFRLVDRLFGLTRDNGYSAFFRDAGGWPVAISRRMFGDADALAMARFTRCLVSPHEIRWVWLADQDGKAWLARRWLLGDMMLEIGAHGWRIGRARTEGRVVWQQGDETAANYDPRQPRDTKGRFATTGRQAMFESLSGDRKVVKAVSLGIIPDQVADLIERTTKIDTRGKSLMLDHSLAVKTLNHHPDVSVRDLFGCLRTLTRADHVEVGGRKGIHDAPRFRAKASGKRKDVYIVGQVHKNTVRIVSLYKVRAGEKAKR